MPKCMRLNCEKEVNARGLCSMHYAHWLHSEEGERLKMKGYGRRVKHPLYGMWDNLKRINRIDVCDEWGDFWVFVEDVGNKPSSSHVFVRKNDSLPYSVSNYEWREKVIKKEKTETQKEYMSRYMRERRKLNPDMEKNRHLKRYFGITIDDYNVMLKSQNDVCAICGSPPYKSDKKTMSLAVDHCHKSGKIRALLCHLCNNGLGAFKDNVEVIKIAIAYLEKHQ